MTYQIKKIRDTDFTPLTFDLLTNLGSNHPGTLRGQDGSYIMEGSLNLRSCAVWASFVVSQL